LFNASGGTINLGNGLLTVEAVSTQLATGLSISARGGIIFAGSIEGSLSASPPPSLTLDAGASGSVSFGGTVGGPNGTLGNLTVSAGTVTGSAGIMPILINSGTLTLAVASSIDSPGQPVTLNVDSISDSGNRIDAGISTVTVQPLTGGKSIGLEDSTGDIKISAALLGNISAGTVKIGDGANTTDIYVGGAGSISAVDRYDLFLINASGSLVFNFSGNDTLDLGTMSLVIDIKDTVTSPGGGSADIKAGTLTVAGAGTIGAAGSPLTGALMRLDGAGLASGSLASLYFSNIGSLTVADIKAGIVSIETTGGTASNLEVAGIDAGAGGDVRLTSAGAMSQGGPVNAGTLSGSAVAGITLTQSNTAGTVSLYNGSAGGTVSYTSGIGMVLTTAVNAAAGGEIRLTSSNGIILNNATGYVVSSNAGSVTFGGPVVMGTNGTVSSGGGGVIVFSGTVDGTNAGSESLVVDAGTGSVTFTGMVGGTELGSLSVTGTTSIAASSVSVWDYQGYSGPVGNTSASALVLTAKAAGGGLGLVSFGDTYSGDVQNMTVDGNAVFNGAVSNTVELAVSGYSTVGADITTTGTQAYAGTVVNSGGARTFTGSTVRFGSGGLDGGGGSITVAGNAEIGGNVGNAATLSVTGYSSIGANVTTAGTQSYEIGRAHV
jgi:hypothetical protein